MEFHSFKFNRESVHFLASPNPIQDVFQFLLDQDTDFNATDDDISNNFFL